MLQGLGKFWNEAWLRQFCEGCWKVEEIGWKLEELDKKECSGQDAEELFKQSILEWKLFLGHGGWRLKNGGPELCSLVTFDQLHNLYLDKHKVLKKWKVSYPFSDVVVANGNVSNFKSRPLSRIQRSIVPGCKKRWSDALKAILTWLDWRWPSPKNEEWRELNERF